LEGMQSCIAVSTALTNSDKYNAYLLHDVVRRRCAGVHPFKLLYTTWNTIFRRTRFSVWAARARMTKLWH
jgi:hypothetical protein